MVCRPDSNAPEALMFGLVLATRGSFDASTEPLSLHIVTEHRLPVFAVPACTKLTLFSDTFTDH